MDRGRVRGEGRRIRDRKRCEVGNACLMSSLKSMDESCLALFVGEAVVGTMREEELEASQVSVIGGELKSCVTLLRRLRVADQQVSTVSSKSIEPGGSWARSNRRQERLPLSEASMRALRPS
jgi:hypothetical protein